MAAHADSGPGRRVLYASLVGTSLEWYDFFLYGTAAALVFGDVFFPDAAPLIGTLLAFATYAVGFVARPLGGIVFGQMGDRTGRRKALVITLLIMGTGTVLIGCLPTYDQVGVLAPILLVVLRFVQGIGLGGEWGGAVLMAIEHGDERRRGLYGSVPQLGVPLGNLLSAGVLGLLALLTSEAAFQSWGWRVGFWLSGVLVLVGLWIRTRIDESPLFEQARKEAGDARSHPVVDVVREHPRELALASAARIGTDVAFYTFVLFILTYAQDELDRSYELGLGAVLVGSAVQLPLIPLFGRLSDRLGRRPVYLAGAIGAAAWMLVFFALLDRNAFGWMALAATGGLVCHAAMYGPQAAFVAEMFGTRMRYSGASLSYQVSGVLGGAVAPIISTALLAATGSSWAVVAYVLVMLGVSVTALALAPETARADLSAVDERPRRAPSARPATG